MQCVMDGGISRLLLVQFRCRYVLTENDRGICRTVGDEA
jgi:hypothetical protein